MVVMGVRKRRFAYRGADGAARIAAAVADGVPFEAASLSGSPGPASSLGRLDAEYHDRVRDESIVYTVYSYGTPIGYQPGDGGEFVILPQHHSQTTAGQRTQVARAMGVAG